MQAIKALYQNGNIRLLEPIVNVDEAELFVIVLDKKSGKSTSPVKTFTAREMTSEQDFQALGLAQFFATDDDQTIDWEELFDVNPR